MTLARLSNTIKAAGIPIDGASGDSAAVRIDFKPEATAPQRAQAEAIVAAFDWSDAAHQVWLAQQEKASASEALDRGVLQSASQAERIVIALAQMILDEFNTHSAQTSAMLAAIAAATSLADLKTRMALVSNIPQRTQQQLVNAIKAKINGGAE
jgi:predicted DNA-binding transcriptional regulator YafY